jgi:hypothetical protein
MPMMKELDQVKAAIEEVIRYRAAREEIDALEKAIQEDLVQTSKFLGIDLDVLKGKPLDPETAGQVQTLEDLKTKLGFVPGIRAKYQNLCDLSSVRLRGATRALLLAYAEQAEAKLDERRKQLSDAFAADIKSGPEDVQKAVTRVLLSSDAEAWRSAFVRRVTIPDSVEDAQDAVALAEGFDAGQNCPVPSLRNDLELSLMAMMPPRP